MKNKEILQKTTEKFLQKTNNILLLKDELAIFKVESFDVSKKYIEWDTLIMTLDQKLGIPYHIKQSHYDFLFSHSFAKAFFGEKKIKHKNEDCDDIYMCCKRFGQPAYEFHLQQMVLEEDPIKYLEKFL